MKSVIDWSLLTYKVAIHSAWPAKWVRLKETYIHQVQPKDRMKHIKSSHTHNPKPLTDPEEGKNPYTV